MAAFLGGRTDVTGVTMFNTVSLGPAVACRFRFCHKPSGSKSEIQHNQRGRGVPTLT